MHNLRIYSNVYTRMYLKRWKSRRLATGSEALTGGRGATVCSAIGGSASRKRRLCGCTLLGRGSVVRL